MARPSPWADSYMEGRQSWMPRRQAELSRPSFLTFPGEWEPWAPSPSVGALPREVSRLLHARYMLALHRACAKCWETEGTQERKSRSLMGRWFPAQVVRHLGTPSAGPVGQRLQDGRRLLSLAFAWLGAQTRTAGGAEGGEGADSPDKHAWNLIPLPAWWIPSRYLPSSHIWGGGHSQLGPERM